MAKSMLLPTSLLWLVCSASAINILLPLYVYPGLSAAAWSPVAKAMAAWPEVEFSVIINPSTGPGTSKYPNDDYIIGIKNLRRYSNAKLLGYSDTAWGKRPAADVRGDIDKYDAWSDYQYGDISMDGIFFDDVPSIYDFKNTPGSQATNETYFENITSYASTALPGNNTPVVCNSGNPGATSFFKFCSTLIEFENTYSMYIPQTSVNSMMSNGAILNQTAIIVYNAPKTLSASEILTMIKTMKSGGVQYIDFTNDGLYSAINGTLLNLVASACNETSHYVAKNKADAFTPQIQALWLVALSLFAGLFAF